MNGKSFAATFAALILLFTVVLPFATAEEKCTLKTAAGTYVMYERGQSVIINPTLQPVLAHYAGPVAPFANIVEVAFDENGVGKGFFWIWAGTIRAKLDPTPVDVTITELNEDCTGKFTYTVNLLDPNVPTRIEERFVMFDNGREIRTIPTTIQNGIYTLAWLGYAHRLSKGGAPIHSCGPQTARGKYLMTCENLIKASSTTMISDTFLLRMDISFSGDYTAELFEKIGPTSVHLPAFGTMTVNPDCSFAGTLDVPAAYQGSILTRGVFFNEGKEFYGMGILNDEKTAAEQAIKYSLCHAERLGE